MTFAGRFLGTYFLRLRTGFTRTSVERCTAYVQLASRHGSRPTIPVDCTAAARAGSFDPSALRSNVDWGPGRRVGATYRQYILVDVRSKSGKTYLGRPYAAVSRTEGRMN